MSKHLKICNAKRLSDAQPTFIVKGINTSKGYETPQHVPLSELNELLISAVIEKVNAAYGKLPEFPESVLMHETLREKIDHESCGRSVKKHLLQTSSLLSHLEHADLVKDGTCFIEFGAGKGKLAYWLGQIIKEKKDCCILLIDRSSHRHKNDNKLKKERSSLIIERIRADIADLKLTDVTRIQSYPNKVGIAKHLCGAATDLALNCLVQATRTEPRLNVTGLVIAFCCHHKCEYSSYVGKDFLKQCGFVPSEFTVLCSIGSWATCGPSLSKRIGDLNGKNVSEDTRTNVKALTPEERERIGRRVKSLLNWGRLEYLKSAGFQCNLIHYTTADVSLENMCIVAKKI